MAAKIGVGCANLTLKDANLLISLQGIQRAYETGTTSTHALRDLNLSIAAGEFVAIMGPSGCGKTTLLNLLGMIDRPSAGRYQFLGREVANLSETLRSELRKQHVGFIFQNFNLIDDLTVAENVELALLYREMSARERRERVARVLDQVALGHRAQYFPAQLSGGQQQRIAIARAVVGEQRLILADEPTGNLDSEQGQEVMEMLRHLHSKGSTIVMVTHSPAHADFASRIVNMLDGRLVTQLQSA